MKVVILAGGRGSRLGGLTDELPKGMVPIGDKPIIEHVIGIYARQGFKDIIIAAGYLGYMFSAWAARNPLPGVHIQVVDTGRETLTGGRLRLLHGGLYETFMLTYCDGLADINLKYLLNWHEAYHPWITVTAVHPPSRFGHLDLDRTDWVTSFSEKPSWETYINGGFMVVEPKALDQIRYNEPFEQETCPRLAQKSKMLAYRHNGFWQCMDTPRDLVALNNMWKAGAPWIG